MRKLLMAGFVVLAAVVIFAMVGDVFPEGSALHDMAQALRNMAGDMFGGGYGAVSPG